ncbi:phosphoenolpyruvate--protein phosphotransferase [Candidatus Venteria ishoeyi]|uniref:Phosphoenolpyruvate-protein phosphotransferase n=1 Tax=Candidatus Venteria ishoeyi TaxID=1899563 RepID=A0A1H6FEL2_9GAMM|nr:phosphoenolpyruvate--protein phosphotransferase [Candidatus Venteria ishoeyi]MDM8548266.1 phosphoenolpyruvate--protein phosphotransferase [Candidatus Venteria ishoeyi]SEH08467.1 Phosphoenolpyruvate-protein phosphotransferase [Candidatus Venteria ishoeyi]
MSFTLHGLGVSRGLVIGVVHILRPQIEFNEYPITKTQLSAEIVRFQSALSAALHELKQIRDQIPLIYPTQSQPQIQGHMNTAAEIASFIDPHILMLEDAMLTQAPVEIIESRLCNAEWALKIQRDKLMSVFQAIDDPYLQSRSVDIEQVVNRVQACLVKQANKAKRHNSNEMDLSGRIVLADDLTPADTALMPHHGIKAFITEFGGINSHTAIIARSLGIPAIVGVRNARRYIDGDDVLVLDGRRGIILGNPDSRSLRYYRVKQNEQRRYHQTLNRLCKAPSITRDGTTISLQANIEMPTDLEPVLRSGADGIGLYRTEFLYMNRKEKPPPDEEEHYRAYVKVLNKLSGMVTIRTLDLGGDKQADDDRRNKLSMPLNPALGLRAVRMCLKDLNLFRLQLRAILRASVHGKVSMMIPMVATLTELHQVKQIIANVQKDLRSQDIPFDPDIPVGVMIEVPSIAICADMFAPHVDFFSIGTNDLIQYTLAIDRLDDEVSYLYDPLNPAVLRLLKNILDVGNEHKKPVSMCGEMAGDSRYVRLLLGMGLRHFSVTPESLLEIKQIIRHSDLGKLQALADRVLRTSNRERIASLVARMEA